MGLQASRLRLAHLTPPPNAIVAPPFALVAFCFCREHQYSRIGDQLLLGARLRDEWEELEHRV